MALISAVTDVYLMNFFFYCMNWKSAPFDFSCPPCATMMQSTCNPLLTSHFKGFRFCP